MEREAEARTQSTCSCRANTKGMWPSLLGLGSSCKLSSLWGIDNQSSIVFTPGLSEPEETNQMIRMRYPPAPPIEALFLGFSQRRDPGVDYSSSTFGLGTVDICTWAGLARYPMQWHLLNPGVRMCTMVRVLVQRTLSGLNIGRCGFLAAWHLSIHFTFALQPMKFFGEVASSR